jgi:translation initiation factor IF-2
MSKLKLVELNKQVASKSEEVLKKVMTLQTDAQQQISVLKKLEAELIKKAREEESQKAMENKAKEEDARKAREIEKMEQQKDQAVAQNPTPENDIKHAIKEEKPQAFAEEIKARPAAEQASKEQMPADNKEAPAKAPVEAEEKPVAAIESKTDEIKVETAQKAPEAKEAPAAEPRTEAREPRPERREPRTDTREPRTDTREPRTDTRDQRPQGDRPQGQYPPRQDGYQRPQGDRPQGDRPQRDYSDRPPRQYEGNRQEGQYQRPQGDRPQGQYPPRQDGYQRPQGDRPQGDRPQGDRPQRDYSDRPPRQYEGNRQEGQYQRPQGDRPQGDRPYPPRQDGQYQRPQGDRPYPPRQDGQYQRPQGDRPYPPRQDGQYQRPQGDRPYPPRQDGQYQRPQGDRPYPPRQDGQYPRPQGQGGYNQGQSGQYPRPQGQGGYNQGQGGFNKDRFVDKDAMNKDERPRQAARPGQKKVGLPSDFTPAAEKQKVSNYGKKMPEKKTDADNKNKVSKKMLVQETRSIDDEDGMPRGSRKRKKEKLVHIFEPIRIEKAVITTETVTIKTLADKIGKPAADIIKKLFLIGMMCTINSEISFETAQLISAEFNIELEHKLDKTFEDTLIEEDKADDEESLVSRPPVVTIMGHVDHGKTSLLDAIRTTRVTEKEAGGITQHIGAYSIRLKNRAITFLDTPGHEAFTAMRARGAQVTDIAVLVVAADDGIMPQTVEAINHAKAAKVPIIVAVNKMDKADANPDRVKQELTEHELLTEEWGGDTIVVPVSAITHEGIDQLLEMILLVADVQELKANPNRMAKGTIIEARLDKGRGPVATVLVQNGTLRISDTIVAGTAYGRVRAMADENGKNVKEALPSMPVEVIGFSEVPSAGDVIYAVEQDKLSKQVAEERRDKQKADMLKSISKVSLEDLFSRIAEGSIKDLNLIVKADVQGSVEAVTQALAKLSNDEVSVKIIHSGVGAIQKTDVDFASASGAIIIGFNVRPDNMARELAEKENIDIRLYRVIYNAIEDIEKALKGMLKPQYEEVILGHAQVRTTFKASTIGTIAGCYITDGKIIRNAKARLLRDNIVVYDGTLSSLKRFKDDAKEVLTGFECGITLDGFNDLKELDVIEAYEMREIKR